MHGVRISGFQLENVHIYQSIFNNIVKSVNFGGLRK